MRNRTGPEALADAMRARDMTQAQLAAIVGADQGSVSRWLRGQRMPGTRFAVALREALGLDVDVWTATRRPPRARRAVG